MRAKKPRRAKLPVQLTAEDVEILLAYEKTRRPGAFPGLRSTPPNQKRIEALEARLRTMRLIGK